MKNMFKSGKIELIDLLPVISLVVLVIIFGITSGGGLFQSFNIQSVIRDSIPVILGGLGVIFVIATGGCDLSIGAVAAVAATVGAYYGSQYGAVWTIIIALLIGLASGIFLGFIVSRCHVSSFMASLALLMGLRGFLNVCNVTWQQVYLPESLLVINQFGPALAITVILTAIIVFLFEKTSFGYYCKGMGENENTMKSIGVNTAKVRHCAFIVSGIMAAIMGLLLISSTGGSSSTLGNFMEMKVQMGVFLGGVLVSGGTINITGSSSFDYDGTAQFTGGTIIVNGQQIDYIPNQMMGGMGGRGGMMGGFGGFGGGQNGNQGGLPGGNQGGFGGRGRG